MTQARQTVKDSSIGIVIADTPEGLSEIHQPDCAAAIWRRNPLPDFQSWINALEPDQLPCARVVLRSEDVRDAVDQICEASGTPDCRERERLVDDTAALADIFARLIRAPYLRLRFNVITANAYQEIQTDAVTARLVCTYRGTGTQYGISNDGAEPRRVFTVPTVAPILLRGALWPEHPKFGLLHRLSPIEGTGETRLLFALDPVDCPDFPAHKRTH